jgi:hypothetical protein
VILKGKEMNSYENIILALSLCVLLTGFTKADDPNEQAVTIALTKFDVNESRLELQWNIKNNSDHDVWICSNFFDFDPPDFYALPESYIAKDKKTLMIRRRLDVPSYTIWTMAPYCRYTRFRPGENRSESLLLHVPILSNDVFGGDFSDGGYASRLVLEIGYYDENLPELILDIIKIAEKTDNEGRGAGWRDNEIARRYFPGLIVNDYLGDSNGLNIIGYSELYGFDTEEEILVTYTFQALSGEKVLRLEINGVHIPMAN